MKKLAVMLLCLLLMPQVAALAQDAPTTTVMVYMCGSNLESQYGLASSDILEMIDSGYDSKHTNVALMLGGSTRWEMDVFDPEKTSICRLRGSSLVEMWQGDAMNMSSSDTLSFFLNTVCERFQTDRYVLILWDHGGGPLGGVCWDENHTNDSLQISELLEGIQNSPFAERKLDMIGFDACLMGSVETAWMLAPYAHYMVASEETEPGSGWDYAFLRGIEEDASMADTGRRIADHYVDSFPADYGSTLTMSCIDLSRIGNVVEKMDAFYAELSGRMTFSMFQEMSSVRHYAQGFGSDFRIQESTDYDLVDMVNLLQALEKYALASGEALEAALDEAIVHSRSNEPDSHGLSVYFPYFNQPNYLKAGVEFYKKTNFCEGYKAYIDKFQVYMAGEDFVDWQGLVPAVTREGNEFLVSLDLTDKQLEDMVSAKLVVFESDFSLGGANSWYRRVYGSADVKVGSDGVLSAPYGDECMVIHYTDLATGGDQEMPIEFTTLESGEYQVEFLAGNESSIEFHMNASTDEPGVSHLMRMTLLPRNEKGALKVNSIQAYDSLTGTFTSRMNDSPDNYDYILWNDRLRLLTREDGLILPYECWPIARERFANNGISITGSAPNDVNWAYNFSKTDGIRYAAFEITDSQNNTFTTELTPVRPLESLTLYQEELAIGNLPIDMEVRCVAHGQFRFYLWIDLINRSGEDAYSFQLGNLLINDQQTSDYSYRTIYNDETGEEISIYSDGGYLVDVAGPQERVSLYVPFWMLNEEEAALSGLVDSITFNLDVLKGDVTDFESEAEYIGTVENVTIAPGIDFYGDVFAENYGIGS